MAEEKKETSFWGNVGGVLSDNVGSFLSQVIPAAAQKYTNKVVGNLNQAQLNQGMTGQTAGVPINTQNQGWLNNATQASGFLQQGAVILPWVLGAGLVTLVAVKLVGGRKGRR